MEFKPHKKTRVYLTSVVAKKFPENEAGFQFIDRCRINIAEEVRSTK